jgi:Protein of unknown function (DUF3093)
MRVYHERLSVPLSWWLVGLATIAILATEVIPGWPLPVEAVIYVVLVGGLVGMLLNWGRLSVDVSGGELLAGHASLPLTAIGEVTALDDVQTRSLRGPRADPAAYLLIRPYLRQSVYVEVTRPAGGAPATAARPPRRPRWLARRNDPKTRIRTMAAAAPYWLICTRHPAELAAAINGTRPAARTDGATMG